MNKAVTFSTLLLFFFSVYIRLNGEFARVLMISAPERAARVLISVHVCASAFISAGVDVLG